MTLLGSSHAPLKTPSEAMAEHRPGMDEKAKGTAMVYYVSNVSEPDDHCPMLMGYSRASW